MLLVTDLHLTDKRQEDYRWELFDWILAYYKKTDDKNVIMLGDLTDAKDHHSAILTNMITLAVLKLVEAGMEVFILMGNHDYQNPACPFFRFLGKFEYVRFIYEPVCIAIQGQRCLFLPHTRDPIGDWKSSKVVSKWCKDCNFVFMHQSVIGSVGSNGYRMERGLTKDYMRTMFGGAVFSGDIHVPQVVGPVEYVGAPYAIRFNDPFRGRAIALTHYPVGKSGRSIPTSDMLKCELPTNLKGRCTIDIEEVDQLQEADASPGDQVKVRFHMAGRSSIPDSLRHDIEEQCKALDFELCSLILVKEQQFPLRKKRKVPKKQSPQEIVIDYAATRQLDKRKKTIGEQLVED